MKSLYYTLKITLSKGVLIMMNTLKESSWFYAFLHFYMLPFSFILQHHIFWNGNDDDGDDDVKGKKKCMEWKAYLH